jgi:ATP-dependent Lon protease
MANNKQVAERIVYPLIPLRDLVCFPDVVFTLFIGRDDSVAAIRGAVAQEELVFLVTQIDAEQECPEAKDLYATGVVGRILKVLNVGNGTMKVLIEGLYRAQWTHFEQKESVTYAHLSPLITQNDVAKEAVVLRAVLRQIDRYAKVHKEFPREISRTLHAYKDLQRCIFVFAGHMVLALDIKQKLLDMASLAQQSDLLLEYILSEIEWFKQEQKVQDRVKLRINKDQRDYYLRLKLDELKKELGEEDGMTGDDDSEDYHKRLEALDLPQADLTKLLKEVAKLKKMPMMSAEATVLRNYFDWLLDLPWGKSVLLKQNIVGAKNILEADHFGLDDLKERVLEHIAVMMRVEKVQGSILCLVGPPGVGKTSFARSIARATGRPFQRISLGGVRDEAEIRGHRKTYIGAMPGRILKAMQRAGASNPLILLDEIDKMGMDYRGDPASALLEVLDVEQNKTFNDHYLELDYDLSQVLFITTANSMDIPEPLVDRMEVIRIAGYTELEKHAIVKRYLLPRQKELAGLGDKEFSLRHKAIEDIIQLYTREAGVRELERQIATLCRKQVYFSLQSKKPVRKVIDSKHLTTYLGVARYQNDRAYQTPQVGVVRGLAWTSVGGVLLTIEATILKGSGKLALTGQLGDVMKESIEAAMTVVKGQAFVLGYQADFFQEHDIHVHVPEGATPKDGPSAGIAMAVVILSGILNNPIAADAGLTGELTLRGEILAIGGLKEKLLAAVRGGLKRVFIPQACAKDLAKLPGEILEALQIIEVKRIEQVFEQVLLNPLVGLKRTVRRSKAIRKKAEDQA